MIGREIQKIDTHSPSATMAKLRQTTHKGPDLATTTTRLETGWEESKQVGGLLGVITPGLKSPLTTHFRLLSLSGGSLLGLGKVDK